MKNIATFITELIYLKERQIKELKKIQLNSEFKVKTPHDFYLKCLYLPDSIPYYKILNKDILPDFDLVLEFIDFNSKLNSRKKILKVIFCVLLVFFIILFLIIYLAKKKFCEKINLLIK